MRYPAAAKAGESSATPPQGISSATHSRADTEASGELMHTARKEGNFFHLSKNGLGWKGP